MIVVASGLVVDPQVYRELLAVAAWVFSTGVGATAWAMSWLNTWLWWPVLVLASAATGASLLGVCTGVGARWRPGGMGSAAPRSGSRPVIGGRDVGVLGVGAAAVAVVAAVGWSWTRGGPVVDPDHVAAMAVASGDWMVGVFPEALPLVFFMLTWVVPGIVIMVLPVAQLVAFGSAVRAVWSAAAVRPAASSAVSSGLDRFVVVTVGARLLVVVVLALVYGVITDLLGPTPGAGAVTTAAVVVVGAVVGAGYGWGRIENAVADARGRCAAGAVH